MRWLCLCLVLDVGYACAAETGTITGVLDRPGAVTAVTAVDRSEEKDKHFKGNIDPKTGKFTVSGLPPKKTYDLVIDFAGGRLEGVNLKVPPSDFEEEQPLTRADRSAITRIAKALNKFENEVDVMVVSGNCQHAAVVLNKRRTTPFYESKPGEMIWRLELWHFQKPDDDWIKDPDELGVIFYRERLQKSAFAKKSLTLDPALGGLTPGANRAIDVGKVVLPDGKAGIKLRETKNKGAKRRAEDSP